MDPVPVLDMYTANLPQEEDYLHEDLSRSSPLNEHQQRLIMIWGSVAAAAIFLLLIISWWQEKQSSIVPTNQPSFTHNEPAEQSDTGHPSIPDIEIKQETIPPEDEIEVAPIQASTPTTNQEITRYKPESPESSSLPVSDPTETEIEKAGQEDYTPDEASHGDTEMLNDTNRSIVEYTETDDRQIDGDTDMPRQLITLVVMSSGESWARVRDGSDEIIIHRTLPPGYNKIFMVNLPLKFEFGNAPQMSIMIDGKDYNFSSHIKPSRVATFEVTELP